jgi:hypothetical protein
MYKHDLLPLVEIWKVGPDAAFSGYFERGAFDAEQFIQVQEITFSGFVEMVLGGSFLVMDGNEFALR